MADDSDSDSSHKKFSITCNGCWYVLFRGGSSTMNNIRNTSATGQIKIVAVKELHDDGTEEVGYEGLFAEEGFYLNGGASLASYTSPSDAAGVVVKAEMCGYSAQAVLEYDPG